MHDIAIIGAGPAGCAAALEAAHAGASVLLLEKAAFPRDKLCGEFLSPEIPQTLDELGCGEAFRAAGPAPIERAMIVSPSGARLELPFPAPAWGLSRLRFDHLLARAAQEAGVELVEKTEISRCAGNVLEARDGRRFEARSVLLAAGRHSLLQPMPSTLKTWFGLKAHFQGECAGRVELYFFRGGYGGLSPVEGGRVNLCCLVEKSLLGEKTAEELLAEVPTLRERLGSMRQLDDFLHTGPVAMGWRQPPPGLLAAGDAALFVDPFTGEGISLALETGRMAARHLLQANPSGYWNELRNRFGRQLRVSSLLRAAVSLPWLERPLLGLFGSTLMKRAAFRATRAKIKRA